MLGLIGKADVVKFHKMDNRRWILNVEIKNGALFYEQTWRREDVVFDEKLRQETEDAARRVHALIESGITPKPEYSKKCKKCSLY